MYTYCTEGHTYPPSHPFCVYKIFCGISNFLKGSSAAPIPFFSWDASGTPQPHISPAPRLNYDTTEFFFTLRLNKSWRFTFRIHLLTCSVCSRSAFKYCWIIFLSGFVFTAKVHPACTTKESRSVRLASPGFFLVQINRRGYGRLRLACIERCSGKLKSQWMFPDWI
jgi:hypothetical protein